MCWSFSKLILNLFVLEQQQLMIDERRDTVQERGIFFYHTACKL